MGIKMVINAPELLTVQERILHMFAVRLADD